MTPFELAALGVAVIPCYAHSKVPTVKWSAYQPDGGRLPTPAELARWFPPATVGRTRNAAAVTGWGGLVVLDFDTLAGYLEWLCWAGGQGGIAAEVATASYAVHTARGMHVYAWAAERGQNGKLFVGGAHVGEVKAWGQYVMLPPSVHPSGVAYRVVSDGAPIARIRALEEILPEPPAPRAPQHAGPAEPAHVFPVSELWPETLIQQIRREVPLLSLFPDAQPSGGGGRWYVTRCPWHEDRSPSLRLDTRVGVAACFAGCTDDRALDVIGVYARLHGVTTRTAIRSLAGQLSSLPLPTSPTGHETTPVAPHVVAPVVAAVAPAPWSSGVRWAAASATRGHFCSTDTHAESDRMDPDGRRVCGRCWPPSAPPS